ncbi:MAG: hypothetical protein RLY93_00750 [Sumerlaeia bacterium]
MMGPKVRLLLPVLAALALAGPGAAQDSSFRQSQNQKREIEDGVVFQSRQSLGRNFARRSEYVGLERAPGAEVSLEVIAAEAGPLTEGALLPMAVRADALSLLGWPLESEGLVFDGETLGRWPAVENAPVLVLLPEGGATLLEPKPSSAARILTEQGAEIPLGAINSAATTGALLLAGRLARGETAVAGLTPETLLIPLIPAQKNTAPARSLWDGLMPEETREWTMLRPRSLGEQGLRDGEWAIALTGEGAAGWLEVLLAARTVRFEVPLPEEIAFARGAIQGGQWLMRQGQEIPAPLPLDPRAPVAFLGVLPEGGGAVLGNSGALERGVLPHTRGDLIGFLSEAGATDAVEFPDCALPRLLPDPRDRQWQASRGQVPATFALAIVPRAPALTLPGPGPDFARLENVAVSAVSQGSSFGNGPEALLDGRLSPSSTLDSFWRLEDGEGAWVEFSLPGPNAIGAIDLIHAENLGFSPQFNIQGWELYGRARRSDRWELIAAQMHEKPKARERIVLDPPRRLGDLRLVVVDPSFQPGDSTVRLAELAIWYQTSASDPMALDAR